jgi:hypothetical protein
MTYRTLRHAAAIATLAAATIAASVAPSAAQVMYGGYNLGPNYGAMIESEMARSRAMAAEMERGQNQIIAQVMQNPRAIAMYQQHRAQGGQMSPQQFAIWYAGTRGGTDVSTFVNNERANSERENDRVRALRGAEVARGQAQMGYINGGHAINQEVGNGLTGRGTYVGPNGQGYVLPNTQPGQVQRDPNTGAAFVMNNQGQYFMYTPNGWQPMQPRY